MVGNKKKDQFLSESKSDEFHLRFVTDSDMMQNFLYPCTQARALRRGNGLCWTLAVM